MRCCRQCGLVFGNAVEACPDDGSALSAPDDLAGALIDGKYRIETLIASGASGLIFRATQARLDRPVAIKILRESLLSDEAALDRFQREALVIARLRHPNILTIYDFGIIGHNCAYIVTEFVDGITLRDELRVRGAIPLDEAIPLARQIMSAIAEAHAAGIVHRDLKPHNILIAKTAQGPWARVLDFGIAWHVGGEQEAAGGESLVGTPLYAAPEQFANEPVDARTDIYSLGVILYQLLTGAPPFQERTLNLLAHRVRNDRPHPPSSSCPSLPPIIDDIVLKALEKDPNSRYQSVEEMDAALAGAQLTPSFALDRTARRGRPLVGRTPEMQELRADLADALAGTCHWTVLIGEAGVGKTRLADELEVEASRAGMLVLRGRCTADQQTSPYDGLAEVFTEFLRLRPGSALELANLADDLRAIFPELSDLESTDAGTVLADDFDAEEPTSPSATGVFETLAAALSCVTSLQPTLVCIDDVHASHGTLAALEYVVRRIPSAPLLILSTAERGLVGGDHALSRIAAAFRGDRRFRMRNVAPLSEEGHRHLVQSIAGAEPVDEVVSSRIFDVSEGNPYFAGELMRSLIESGGVRLLEGAWRFSPEAGLLSAALPETMQQMALQRVASLSSRSRDVLAAASVLGKRFPAEELRAVVDDPADLDDVIDLLLERGLLEEDLRTRHEWLAFASGVVREVLYGTLSRRQRRAIHKRVADHLEEQHPDRLDRDLPRLLHHTVEAGLEAKAVQYGLTLATRALAALAPEEAIAAARTALDHLTEEESCTDEGAARVLLARAYRMFGDVDRALLEFETAVNVFEGCGDAAAAAETMALLAETAFEARRLDATRRWVERGIIASRHAKQCQSLADLLSLAATLANLGGEHDRARILLDEAAALRPQQHARTGPLSREPLIVGVGAELTARHPVEIRFSREAEVLACVFETLVTSDERAGPVPHLASHFEAVDEGRAFVFTLREGITFHDGRLLSADLVRDAVEAAIRRAGDQVPAALAVIAGAAELSTGEATALSGIEVLSPQVFALHLSSPIPIYPAMLTDPVAAIVLEAADGSLVGTGPFKLASCGPERVVLERNPSYWAGMPLLPGVEFLTVPQSIERLRMLRAGEIDLTGGLDPDDVDALMQRRSRRTRIVEATRANGCFICFLSASLPALSGAAFPLLAALHPAALVPATIGRFAQPASSLIPPGILAHDAGRRSPSMSIEEASNQLATTALALPYRLAVGVSPAFVSRYGALLDAIFQQWAALGVEAYVATTTNAEFHEACSTGAGIDVIVMAWDFDYADPDDCTYALFHSKAGVLPTLLGSDRLDAALEEARSESRPAVRERLYRRIEDAILQTGLILPLRLQGLPPFVNYAQVRKIGGSTVETVPSGALSVPVRAEFTELDPQRCYVDSQTEALSNVFETLLRAGSGTQVVPWLVESYRIEMGGRRYCFRLRDNVRFHDGRRLTARDVRYSFERLLRVGESYRYLLSSVKGADRVVADRTATLEGFQVVSPTEFQIELDQPLACFPAVLSCGATAIVREQADNFAGDWRSGCVGTGPFRVAAFQPGVSLDLEANPDYWREGFPKSRYLTFTIGVNNEERVQGFKEGRYHVLWNISADDDDVLRRNATYARHLRDAISLSTFFVAFNANSGVCADPQVRRRIVAALDVEALLKVQGRTAVRAHSFLPPELLGYVPDAHPVPEGRRGAPLKLRAVVMVGLQGPFEETLVRGLAEHRIHVEICNTTFSEYEKAVASGDIDMSVTGWLCDYPDPDGMVSSALMKDDGFCGRLLGSKELDRLCEEGRRQLDVSIRRDVYREIEDYLAHQTLVLPLFHKQATWFAQPGVKGLQINLFQPYVAYDNLELT